MLSDYHIDGIPDTVFQNGNECIAEYYVLKCRGKEILQEAEELYNKYMGE